jgi:hypothetical protein
VHTSIFKTRPFHRTLKEAFGTSPFFGGRKGDAVRNHINVAVTSTSDEGRRPMVLANYNRRGEETSKRRSGHDRGYRFLRPHNPSEELAIWEVAAATSAATPFFKGFYHGSSYRTFLDGAFYYNNPSRVAQKELELLWPDVAERRPDVFLSIGTSQDKEHIDEQLETIGRDDLSREM